MGWGLRTAEPVSRGSLVIEYIGEVVDESQMQVHRAPSFSYNHTLLHIELPLSLTTAHYCISKSLLLSHPHVIAYYSLLSDYHHVTLLKLKLIFHMDLTFILAFHSFCFSVPPFVPLSHYLFQTRMSDQRKFTPNDHNFYIMQLDTGFYVDGKHKGS